MKELDKEAIEMISELNDFHIAPYREDGETFGTLTWIWVVEVEGSLYVRAYNGVNSIWYKSALSQKSGKIKSNGTEFKVQFQPVSGEINDEIDAAYKAKYYSSPYLQSMISNRAKAATVKVF
ncbi:MAG: hypothetical protein CMO82_06740 [Winogradskyella sp.]|nr:hypothetical protein [Winogradskyella sp.]|tara:strand:- start:617 stop:982 length:366 start_codon:yes stop_codon:yes gene_type:complete